MKSFQKLSPFLAAAGFGSAIGASTSDDRKKGAVKGALIGLGSVAGGKILGKASNRVIKNVGGRKLKDALTVQRMTQSGKSNAEIAAFLKSRGYTKDTYKELGNVLQKATTAENITSGLAPTLGLAGTAYALKNGNSSKKR